METIVKYVPPIGALFSDSFFNSQWFLDDLADFNLGKENYLSKACRLFEKRTGNILDNTYPIGSLFNVYAVNERYLNRFFFQWHADRAKMNDWRTIPVNLFFQGGKLIYTLAVTALEDQFSYGSQNFKNGTAKMRLLELSQNLESTRDQIHAKYISYAGIMPSVKRSLGISNSFQEAETTISGVMKAIEKVMKKLNLPDYTPVVIIGIRGHIGSVLVKRLPSGLTVIPIDNDNKDFLKKIVVRELSGERVLVLNIASGGALEEYVDYFPSGWILLNEAYDNLKPETVYKYNNKGVLLLTINGFKSWVMISLGDAYENCIPLCAANPDCIEDLEILISKVKIKNVKGKMKVIYEKF